MNDKSALIAAYRAANNDDNEFRPKDLYDYARSFGFSDRIVREIINGALKIRYGVYAFNKAAVDDHIVIPFEQPKAVQTPPKPQVADLESVFIPPKSSQYIKWGHHKDVQNIIESKQFYPVFITGMSGNGKTMMVEQACAHTNREFIRIQITPETDEDDLIGGFRLVDGNTVFVKGPVIRAMEAGAICLLDELDRSSHKVMCLQSVVEGKPVLIKKTGELVKPAPGFNIIATANTKGKGSLDGRYIAAGIMDDAFLERFTIMLEQPYPKESTELRILKEHAELFGVDDLDFITKLSIWSAAIRKTFTDGGIDDIVSTRRLCHIVQTFSIFKNRMKSIALCVARFDEDTAVAFANLYKSIDASASITAEDNE